MADLDGDGRGQILLVAAFALAVIFVSLAIVANAAIYTENLATRSGSVDASDALAERHAIEQAAGDAVRAANWNDQTSGYTGVRVAVDEGVQNLDDWAGLHAGRQGTMVSVDLAAHNRGRRLVQTNDTTFESSDGGGGSDWTLANDVDRTRAFVIDVTDADAAGAPFTVNVTRAPASNWTMTVEAAGGDVVVDVERESPDRVATCRVPEDYPVTIDVTGATVDGTPCPALAWVDGEAMHVGAGVGSGYNVRFENGHEAAGNYSLIVDEGASIPGSNYGSDGGSGSQPYEYPAMYEAFVDLQYHGQSVDYETQVRVAPGEIDD